MYARYPVQRIDDLVFPATRRSDKEKPYRITWHAIRYVCGEGNEQSARIRQVEPILESFDDACQFGLHHDCAG